MKKTTKFLIFLAIFLILVLPVFSSAQTDTDIPDEDFLAGKSLVPCGRTNPAGVISNPCSFKDALTLINAVIKFILFYMAIPIAAIMFVYAGFLMLVPGSESASKKTKGKEIFWNAFIGLILAAAAWLIIRTILLILGYPGDWIGF